MVLKTDVRVDMGQGLDQGERTNLFKKKNQNNIILTQFFSKKKLIGFLSGREST